MAARAVVSAATLMGRFCFLIIPQVIPGRSGADVAIRAGVSGHAISMQDRDANQGRSGRGVALGASHTCIEGNVIGRHAAQRA